MEKIKHENVAEGRKSRNTRSNSVPATPTAPLLRQTVSPSTWIAQQKIWDDLLRSEPPNRSRDSDGDNVSNELYAPIWLKEKLAVQTMESISEIFQDQETKRSVQQESSSITSASLASRSLLSRMSSTFTRVMASAHREAISHQVRPWSMPNTPTFTPDADHSSSPSSSSPDIVNQSTTLSTETDEVPEFGDRLLRCETMSGRDVETFIAGIEEVKDANGGAQVVKRRYWRILDRSTRKDESVVNKVLIAEADVDKFGCTVGGSDGIRMNDKLDEQYDQALKEMKELGLL